MIENCAGLDLKNEENEQTPLHIAAKKGNKEIVELLIKSGANVRTGDQRRNSALDLARYNGNSRFLDNQLLHRLIGKNLLHITDHYGVVDLLRESETVSDERAECTALHKAVAEGITYNAQNYCKISFDFKHEFQ